MFIRYHTIKMAPRHKRKTRSGTDILRFPLTYSFASAGTSVTTIKTLTQTFDRSRAFRICALRGEMAAFKFPVCFQFEVFGPVSSADNVFATPVMTVAVGSVKKFRFRLPASSTGWYPSQTAVDTKICQLVSLCLNKNFQGGIAGVVTLTLALRPYEQPDTCPAVQVFVPFDDDDDDESPSSSFVELPVPAPEV